MPERKIKTHDGEKKGRADVKSAIVWFRQDLRLADNPALAAAVDRGGPVICLFIEDFDEHGDWPPGAARRWWLHHSLAALDARLREKGNRLILRRGRAKAVLEQLLDETAADAVFWNRRYEPALVQRDRAVEAFLKQRISVVQNYNAALLYEPWTIQTKQGGPYQVFTPFWRACQQLPEPAAPAAEPQWIPRPVRYPASESLDALRLLPAIDWASGLREAWKPGENGACEQLRRFLAGPVDDYAQARDIPAQPGTSRLSPHLCHGEIGPRQIWRAVRKAMHKGREQDAWKFLSEVGWREFAHHLIYHFPHTPTQPLREQFRKFPWRRSARDLKAWQEGLTGYPIVDAGMRELWRTGWMHNRVRMIVASFLVKDLRISWLEGAKWFWDTLVDADLANNTLGWQWAGGCGADAAPYFRIFNPALQSRKFDGDETYIRRWIPELADAPSGTLHVPDPRKLSGSEGFLRASAREEKHNFRGAYPRPIVDHSEARDAALAAFSHVKG